MKEPTHNLKCQGCGEPAEYNLQTFWHLYKIGKNESYKEIKTWEADDNEFWCKECAEAEQII